MLEVLFFLAGQISNTAGKVRGVYIYSCWIALVLRGLFAHLWADGASAKAYKPFKSCFLCRALLFFLISNDEASEPVSISSPAFHRGHLVSCSI